MSDRNKKVQPFERATKLSLKEILLNNFLGGIMWALGATLGLSLIIWILSILAANVNFVPIVGDFVSDVINFILDTNPNIKNK